LLGPLQLPSQPKSVSTKAIIHNYFILSPLHLLFVSFFTANERENVGNESRQRKPFPLLMFIYFSCCRFRDRKRVRDRPFSHGK
jgi:hypothetical protein